MSNLVAGMAVCRCAVIGRADKVDVQSFWETELEHLYDTRALHHHIHASIITAADLPISAFAIQSPGEFAVVAHLILHGRRWRRPLQRRRW
jgi:hypothetical protein